MNEPPKDVPRGARWDQDEKLWVIGKKKGGLAVGEWRKYRADGSLFGVYGYDAIGSADGRHESFHPDGTLAHLRVFESFHDPNRGPRTISETWQRADKCPAKYPACECWAFPNKKPVWRVETDEEKNVTKYFLRDGTPCDKSGKPKGKARAKAPKAPPTKNALVKKWRAFESVLYAAGLSPALHYAPAKLRWERAPAFAKTCEALLPDDYRAFVAEVGYPMLGFGLYDDAAWSFLPPAAMRGMSADLPDANDEEPTKACHQAFFAGHRDLADITGWSFAKNEKNGVEVFRVQDAMLRKPLGSFTKWMESEIARLTKLVEKMPAKKRKLLAEQAESEEDPHRLIDYSND